MKNKQGGFLKLVIFIVVILIVLSYFNVSVKEFINWFINAIRSIF